MPKMFNKKTARKPHRGGRLWWLSGLVVLTMALLVTKFTLNLGYLLLSHGNGHGHWSAPFEVWAKNGEDKAAARGAKAAAAAIGGQQTASGVSEMIARLEQRESDLNRKEEELRRKEDYLKQMQKETEQKLQKLIVAQDEIQAYRDQKKSAETDRMKSLIKIYESMKPKGAAKLLESLDEQLVVKIISQMDTNLAATILANMDPAKAVKISTALTAP